MRTRGVHVAAAVALLAAGGWGIRSCLQVRTVRIELDAVLAESAVAFGFSRDGEFLFLVVRREGGADIVRKSIGSSGETRVFVRGEVDGLHVAAESSSRVLVCKEPSRWGEAVGSAWLVDFSDRSALDVRASLPGDGRWECGHRPLSPNGRYVALQFEAEGDTQRIHVLDTATRRSVQLGEAGTILTQSRWTSPDSVRVRCLVGFDWSAGRREVRSYDARTGASE